MSQPKHPWLARIGLTLGVLAAAGVGLYSIFKAASTPLHSNPEAVPSVQRGSPTQKWAAAVKQSQQIARAVVVEQNLPGLSVAVGVDDDIVWAEGFGWADIEKQLPVAPHHRFRIGHASKALTSAAVGVLLEQGRLRLDDEIQRYVPQFPRKPWPVTLRQLMGHVSGIKHYTESEHLPTAPCARASEGLRRFADAPLRFEPGTQYGYSTYGWVLVSAAVEAAANEPFFTFARTKVFTPLGMAQTMPDSGTEPMLDRSTFYTSEFFGVERVLSVDYSCFAGAAGFLSTPSDLVRFGLAINTGKLLKPDTVTMLQSPQRLASGEETGYGLGWMLSAESLAGEPARVAGHSSRTPVGGSTSFLIFPGRGIVVAATANVAKKDMRSVALRIAQVFAEQLLTRTVTTPRERVPLQCGHHEQARFPADIGWRGTRPAARRHTLGPRRRSSP